MTQKQDKIYRHPYRYVQRTRCSYASIASDALDPDSAISARPIHAGAPLTFSLMACRYEIVACCTSPSPNEAFPASLQHRTAVQLRSCSAMNQGSDMRHRIGMHGGSQMRVVGRRVGLQNSIAGIQRLLQLSNLQEPASCLELRFNRRHRSHKSERAKAVRPSILQHTI